MNDVLIPGYVWAAMPVVLGSGLTFIGFVLKSYTKGVDDRLNTCNRRLDEHDDELTELKIQVVKR